MNAKTLMRWALFLSMGLWALALHAYSLFQTLHHPQIKTVLLSWLPY